jgi:hypothetical protein
VFDNSLNLVNISGVSSIFEYSPKDICGNDPYTLGVTDNSTARSVNKVHKYDNKPMKTHPIVSSSKMSINRYPVALKK